jgi:hypothetical protein
VNVSVAKQEEREQAHAPKYENVSAAKQEEREQPHKPNRGWKQSACFSCARAVKKNGDARLLCFFPPLARSRLEPKRNFLSCAPRSEHF